MATSTLLTWKSSDVECLTALALAIDTTDGSPAGVATALSTKFVNPPDQTAVVETVTRYRLRVKEAAVTQGLPPDKLLQKWDNAARQGKPLRTVKKTVVSAGRTEELPPVIVEARSRPTPPVTPATITVIRLPPVVKAKREPEPVTYLTVKRGLCHSRVKEEPDGTIILCGLPTGDKGKYHCAHHEALVKAAAEEDYDF